MMGHSGVDRIAEWIHEKAERRFDQAEPDENSTRDRAAGFMEVGAARVVAIEDGVEHERTEGG
jgi:hypothetical protein